MSARAAARGVRWKPLAIAALAATVVMGLGGLMTDVGPWSETLRVPAWKPPDWLFAPIWTAIFALWAMAAYLGWREAPDEGRRQWAVASLALNGFLNVLWSLLFFRLRHPDWALVEVAVLWLSILLAMVALWRCSTLAGVLLVPYLAWVSVAAMLNSEVGAPQRAVFLSGPGSRRMARPRSRGSVTVCGWYVSRPIDSSSLRLRIKIEERSLLS